MTEKSSNKRRLRGLYLIVFILLFGTIGGVSAKYMYDDGIMQKLFVAKEFYFTSDLLTEEGKDYELNADIKSVSFELGNNADELRFSEDDVTYMVTVAVADGAVDDDVSLSADGVTGDNTTQISGSLENEKVSRISVKLTGLDRDKKYIVTATGEAGYEKTITATFKLAEDDEKLYKHLDESNDAFVLLTVWAENLDGNLSISYNKDNLIPDSTEPVLKAVHNYSLESGSYGKMEDIVDGENFVEKYSSCTYRFFKNDTDNISLDDFDVRLTKTDNSDHVAEEAELK